MAKEKKSGNIYVSIGIPDADVRRLTRLINLLSDREAPVLAAGLQEAQRILVDEISSRAPRVVVPTIRAHPVGPRSRNVTITISHGAAKEMEFGRKKPRWIRPRLKRVLWWPGAEHPVRKARHGPFAARPFIGVMDRGHAIGAAEPRIRDVLAAAIDAEFDRLAGGA